MESNMYLPECEMKSVRLRQCAAKSEGVMDGSQKQESMMR